MPSCQNCGPSNNFHLSYERHKQLKCLCLCDKCLNDRSENWGIPVYHLDILRCSLQYELKLIRTVEDPELVKKARKKMKERIVGLVKYHVSIWKDFDSKSSIEETKKIHDEFLEKYKDNWYKNLGLEKPVKNGLTFIKKGVRK